MKTQSTDYIHAVDVWGNVETINEIGATENVPNYIKTIKCQIIPMSTNSKDMAITQGNVNINSAQFKFRCRNRSIDPSKDMWFIYNQQKYDILYWNIDFKNNEFKEFICIRGDD